MSDSGAMMVGRLIFTWVFSLTREYCVLRVVKDGDELLICLSPTSGELIEASQGNILHNLLLISRVSQPVDQTNKLR